VNFVGLRDAGDPVELASSYDRAGADEVVFLDITATSDDRSTTVDLASRAAKERTDAGFGVNNTGLAVFLDFSEAFQRLGRQRVDERYGNLFDMYEEITDVDPHDNPMMIFPASFNNDQVTQILQEVRHKTGHIFATIKNQIEIIQGCYCIMSNQGCYIGIQGSQADRASDFFSDVSSQTIFLS